MKRRSKILTATAGLLLVSGLATAQVGLPQVVIDIGANSKLAQDIIYWGKQLGIALQTYTSVHNQEMWISQLWTTKLQWKTLLMQALLYQTVNLYGETVTWNTTGAQSTGIGARITWANATVTLGNMNPLLAGQPVGTAPMAQLATVETIATAGQNSLSTINGARSYLTTSAPAMTALQNSVMDNSAGNNGPTQQMQLIAAVSEQQNSAAHQNLQVNTAVLETLTPIAKTFGDSATYDLNMQAKTAQTYQTQPVLPGGYGSDFMNHK